MAAPAIIPILKKVASVVLSDKKGRKAVLMIVGIVLVIIILPIQHTVIDIKKKFGKNAIVKGMNLEEGATAMDRNKQIGGHKA